jgi:hypothetical protein
MLRGIGGAGMRLFVSALVVLATSAAASVGIAQTQRQAVPAPGSELAPGMMTLDLQAMPMLPQSQAGCPVVLTSARLNWPASYLPVTSAEKVTEPNLALGFRNTSGKEIRAVSLNAYFVAKRSIYELDATTFKVQLTFSAGAADEAAEQLREIHLPEKMHAYGVTRVSLEQVTFGDGTFWMAMGRNNCSLNVTGTTERVAK